jgi:hypothetical protein
MILHAVGQNQVDTRTLHFSEGASFVVIYHAVDPLNVSPSATLTITRNGKQLGSYQMAAITYQGKPAFYKHLTMKKKSMAGKLYAHFHLSLGSATAKRDRRFYVLPAQP